MPKQFHRIQVVETKMRGTGKPAAAVLIPDAGAYVVFDDPDTLMALAKSIEEWAVQLSRKQRGGGATIQLLPGMPSPARSISPN